MKKLVVLLCLNLLACHPIVQTREVNLISAVGTASISTQIGQTEEDKKFKAIRASKLEAYKELTEQVYGIQINSQMQIIDQGLISDTTSAKVNGVIRAAKVLKSYQIGDTYVTELEVNLDKMKQMLSLGEAQYIPRNDKVIF